MEQVLPTERRENAEPPTVEPPLAPYWESEAQEKVARGIMAPELARERVPEPIEPTPRVEASPRLSWMEVWAILTGTPPWSEGAAEPPAKGGMW